MMLYYYGWIWVLSFLCIYFGGGLFFELNKNVYMYSEIGIINNCVLYIIFVDCLIYFWKILNMIVVG